MLIFDIGPNRVVHSRIFLPNMKRTRLMAKMMYAMPTSSPKACFTPCCSIQTEMYVDIRQPIAFLMMKTMTMVSPAI